jgi:hypothetical protein
MSMRKFTKLFNKSKKHHYDNKNDESLLETDNSKNEDDGEFEKQFREFVEEKYGNTNLNSVKNNLLSLPIKKKKELLQMEEAQKSKNSTDKNTPAKYLEKVKKPSSKQNLIKTLQNLKVMISSHATFENEFLQLQGVKILVKEYIGYLNDDSKDKILKNEILKYLVFSIEKACKNNEGLEQFISFPYSIREIAMGLKINDEETRNSILFLLTTISIYKNSAYFGKVLDSMNHFSLVDGEERRFTFLYLSLKHSSENVKSAKFILAFINVLIGQPLSNREREDIKKDFLALNIKAVVDMIDNSLDIKETLIH